MLIVIVSERIIKIWFYRPKDRATVFETVYPGSSPGGTSSFQRGRSSTVSRFKFLLEIRLMVRRLAVNQHDVGSNPMSPAIFASAVCSELLLG